MKTKNNILYLIIAFFTVVPGTYAQEAHPSDVVIENRKAVKQNDRVTLSFDILLDALQVKSNNILVLTPLLKSKENGNISLPLDPVVVAGKKRAKILRRKHVLGENLPVSEPAEVVTRKNNTAQSVHYHITIPYREWMRNASLSLVHEQSGCAECGMLIGEQPLMPEFLPAPYRPVYKLTYIMPEAEEKIRSDRHTASFNFVVGRWELRPDYGGNAAKLAEVDRVVNEIRHNPDLTITEFTIDGYASPEGNQQNNRTLAGKRADAFADYLVSKFNVPRNRFKVTGHGEDWARLRDAVNASSLADRRAVLDIIDRIANPDARDAELMKLSGGETYRQLLNHFYPPLRRTEYVVAYNVRGFDVEEAREIIRTNPKLLSLNEMYLLAQTYPVESAEFSEVFDIAARLYPDSDIAILNSAAADIEGGNMDGAITRMNKVADNPKVWNNLGVAHARKGDFDKAKEYFGKAVSNGDDDARVNLEELNKTLATN